MGVESVSVAEALSDADNLEHSKRTFTFKITEIQHLNYWERLHELKLSLSRDAVNVI